MKLLQSFVKSELKSLGISFKSNPDTGEFKVGGSYYTDDLQDALDSGRAMFNRNAAANDAARNLATV